jgi:hypothetical protein
MKLSPKALRLVDAAVRRSENAQLQAAWASYDHDPAKDLPERAGRAALVALQRFEDQLRKRLESQSLNEDEASDLSNDLGFICAIENDLKRQAEHA